MDILDLIMDLIVGPGFDFVLCRGNVGLWLKKCAISFFLMIGNLLSLVILFFSIQNVSVPGIIIGAALFILFAILDFRYCTWWYQYGRFGVDPPWLDEAPPPKTDPSIWDQIGVKK